MAKQKTSQYEAMFLFGANATAEPEAALTLSRKFIETHGGQITVLKKWDERKLSYEVAKNKRGTYILAFFTAPTSAITPIERDVKLSEEVLRVLILKAEHLNTDEVQAMEPQKPEPREERPSFDRGFGGGGYGGGGGGYGDRSERPSYGDRAPRGGRDAEPSSFE